VIATATTVRYTLNGERRTAPAGTRLAAVLAELGLDPRRVAVERNHEVVPRAGHAEVVVQEGDAYEIVHFVGGG
jgi:thiamine biosynthesis protein ThiS